MNLNRRIEALEKRSVPTGRYPKTLVFIRVGESKEDAVKRYCSEYDLDIEETGPLICIQGVTAGISS